MENPLVTEGFNSVVAFYKKLIRNCSTTIFCTEEGNVPLNANKVIFVDTSSIVFSEHSIKYQYIL